MKHKSTTISALCALIIGLFFLTFNQSTRAQSAFDCFNPNGTNGRLNKIAILVGLVVNDNGDGGDVTPGNGVCETAGGNGVCTLRAAVQEANALAGNDTITFAPTVTSVMLTAEIQIVNPAGALTINGNGANVTTIDGGSATNRVFNINNATVTITAVTISGGRTIAHGGGVQVDGGGTLVLDAVTVQNNRTLTESTSSNGGGIYGNGAATTIRVTNSTISGNSGYSGGGISINTATLFVANSTFSDNTARGFVGGGFAVQSNGNATVRNITVTNNRITGTPDISILGGGGIRIFGTLNIGNSIVAGNTSTAPGAPDIRLDSGTITSVGGNLIGNNADAGTTAFDTTGMPNANNDYVGTTGSVINPMLSALGFASTGTTRVHLLMPGSPAIDHATNANAVNPFDNQPLTTDQRLLARIINGSFNSLTAGLQVDIGAVEFSVVTAANVSVSGRVLTPESRGLTNAIVTLTDSRGITRSARTTSFGNYSFADVRAGETYIVAVSSKLYQFTPQVLSVNDSIADLNFIANESGGKVR